MKIYPARSLNGTVHLPGDKSISHRAAMIAAMAVGETRIENFSTAADCQTTINCLKELGVSIMQKGTEVIVTGVDKTGFCKPKMPLDCGNSGTTMRLLAGILAGQDLEVTLTGDRSLLKRPMQRIVIPLEKMGARLETNGGRAPLTISGVDPLESIEHTLEIASAQVKSSILFAALNADGETLVIEPVPTRDHTERMLEWLGADIKVEKNQDGTRISLLGRSELTGRDVSVPSDISSAAFFMTAAACLNGSEIELPNIGVNPTRRVIVDTLLRCGAEVEIVKRNNVCNEPVATIKVRGGLREAAETIILDRHLIASLIDELPIVAILGTQLQNGIEVRGAGELRMKETDRIAAITENLKRMGAKVTEFDDGFKVERSQLTGAVVDSFGDHRIAMAFAVAGLLADGETEIIGAECADISFPGFFDTLKPVVN